MANTIYPKAKEAFLSGQIVMTTDTIKAVLIDTTDYTYSDADQFLSSIPAAAIEETSAALDGKTITNGVFDANDITFVAASGDPCEAIILYKDTGDAASSSLIAYIDTATGLPVILNSGDINVQWSEDADKIFAL